ncbi:MAG TPA: hypothetical protein PLB38_01145 [bacterium]|mgnify:CR=1 FL=1|nr:hypothetical protein [bacterium]
MKKIFSGFLLLLGIIFFVFPIMTMAASDYGTSDLGTRLGYSTENVNQEILLEKVGRFISIFLGLLGVIFLVFILFYGFQWMTAGGDSKKVQSAKDGIVNLVIGLVLVLSAYAITSFVIKLLTGVNQ